MAKKKNNLKRTIKYLSICKNPQIITKVIKDSPDNVVKSICNAALNVAQGDVVIKNKQKRLLAANRKLISQLIRKGEPVKRKKKVLTQKGGGITALLVPTLLSAVLSTLGSKLFQ